MRPPKISRDELLQRCAMTFKRHGYHGTTMEALATACDLTKASFYHHYPSKDSLLEDVLEWMHQRVASMLFRIARDETLSSRQRLERMGQKASRLFQEDGVGCLMGVIATDVAYTTERLVPTLQRFFDEWASAVAEVYRDALGEEAALEVGRQLVAHYEGAILLARIYRNTDYIEHVNRLAMAYLEGKIRVSA